MNTSSWSVKTIFSCVWLFLSGLPSSLWTRVHGAGMSVSRCRVLPLFTTTEGGDCQAARETHWQKNLCYWCDFWHFTFWAYLHASLFLCVLLPEKAFLLSRSRLHACVHTCRLACVTSFLSFLLACLLSCLFVCLLTCLFACFVACFLAYLLASCFFASVPPSLPPSFLVCLMLLFSFHRKRNISLCTTGYRGYKQ